MSLIMDPVSPFSHSTSSTHPHHHQQQNLLTSAPNRHRHPSQHQPSAFTPANRVIQHRPESRSRSTSIANPARLESILPDQIREELPLSPARPGNPNWSSPHNSPRPHPFFESVRPTSNPSAWVPTPPRSDSGVVGIPGHAVASPMNPASPHPPSHFVPSTSAAPMSQVNYGMPAQYGPLGIDEASLHGSSYHFDQGYRQSMQQPPVSQPYDFSQADTYGTSAMRTSSPMPMQQAYGDEYRLAGAYDMNRSHTGDSIPRPLPSTTIASNASNYTSSAYQRSPSMYDSSVYGQHSIPAAQPMPGQLPGSLNYAQPMYNASSMSSLPRSMSSVSADSIRGSSQKPKPQCWEHGCNGRKFSTFSNLLRHQREKSGTASKSYCPKCGAEFTRTTARNGHLAHDKCTKQRKSSSEGRT